MQRDARPFDDDELQRGARPPEERGDGEGNLPQAILPQVLHAMREVGDRAQRIGGQVLQRHAGARHLEVEERGDGIHDHDDGDRRFGRRIDAGIDEREVEVQEHPGNVGVQQQPAEHGAQYDGGDGEALDPAVRDDELLVRQVFGQDAVLRRRIRRGTEADDRVGRERIEAPQHQHAADDLDAVGEEHHLALRQAVGERANVRREQHVGDDEEELEVGREP